MATSGRCFAVVAAVMATAGANFAMAQWSQWGGPNRDFSASAAGLAFQWPESGPRKVWHRPLGEGFSSIVADGDVLYTMYREGKEPFEFTVALDAKSGKTIWEKKHASAIPDGADRYPGPHATPLVTGDRVYTVGRNAVLRCYEKKDGKLHWERDLVKDFGAKFSQWGYAPSPIAYENLVILPVSRKRPNFGDGTAEAAIEGEGRTLMAFSQEDGKLAWKSQDFGIGESSPVLFKFEGKDHLILSAPEALFAVEPTTGKLLWKHEPKQLSGAMATPLVLDGDRIFCSNPGSGSEVLQLTSKDGKVVPESKWTSRKLRMAFSNPVRVHDFVVGSSGNNPAILVCMNLTTGKRLWADRSLARSVLVEIDGRLIMLDEDGELALATVDSKGLTIQSRYPVAEKECFTTPTLVGTTLYLRDRKNIMAFYLGNPGQPG